MRLLSVIHRWTGGFIGLLLALLGLTGVILVWEGEWITLAGSSDAVVEDVAKLAEITEAASSGGKLSRITFASDEIGLHQLIYADGSGAYVRQNGVIVDQWASMWGRPELWLFELHHRLFAGETGEMVTGIAGVAGMLFVITGVTLWWRSRRAFRLRLLPTRLAPGPIVSHHRDLGLVTAPLLAVSMLTGLLMLFAPMRTALLGVEQRPKETINVVPRSSAAQVLRLAKARFPRAELRRVTLAARPGDPIAVRMRQAFEWTPHGRTQISVAANGAVTIEDAVVANRSASLTEKIYPTHSAKVGGLGWRLAMTASGFALTLLGSLAMWSFWARLRGKRARRRQ
ncbi:MAG: PepSY-associated TM helix domain-containing protein [Pseudomonadota bacterium]